MTINPLEILRDTDNYLSNLQSDLKSTKIKPFQTMAFNSIDFRTAEILNDNIKKVLKSDSPLIYTIELKQKVILPILLNSFENFSRKNKKKIKNKDRVNISRYNTRNSKFLYVGSSTTDIHSRIKNHFGTRGVRVYGLHLCKWDQDLEYDVIVSTYEVSNAAKETTSRVLVELLEQQIWDKLCPIFGKRSGQ